MCKPKKLSGVGITRVREVNKALLTKWLWRFSQEKESLWQQVVAEKHGVINEWETKRPSLPHGCGRWKVILNHMKDFQNRTVVEIGSGSKTRFWRDRWCSSRPLMEEYPNLYRLARNKETGYRLLDPK